MTARAIKHARAMEKRERYMETWKAEGLLAQKEDRERRRKMEEEAKQLLASKQLATKRRDQAINAQRAIAAGTSTTREDAIIAGLFLGGALQILTGVRSG